MSNLSAGVEILVEQLKNNPEAFFGPITHDSREGYVNPKFAGWRQAIEDELLGIDSKRLQLKNPTAATWFLSDEEKGAIVEAYTAARRQRFDAETIFTLNAKPEPHPGYVYAQSGGIAATYTEAMRLDSSGTLGIGTVTTATAIMGATNGSR